MRLYINQERYLDSNTSYVIFASKKAAIANAKTWTGDKNLRSRIVETTTWRTHDDCGLGIYLSEINGADYLSKNAQVINIEYSK